MPEYIAGQNAILRGIQYVSGLSVMSTVVYFQPLSCAQSSRKNVGNSQSRRNIYSPQEER